MRLILGNAHVRKECMELSVIKTVHQVVLELVTKSLENVILVLQDYMGASVLWLVVLDVHMVSAIDILDHVPLVALALVTQVKNVSSVLITVLDVMMNNVLNVKGVIIA